MMNKSISSKNIEYIVKYGIIGILGVGIDAGAYAVLLWLSVPLLLAKAISITLSVLFGYIFNARWTFSVAQSKETFVKYILLYALSIIANLWVNVQVIDILIAHKYYIQIAFLFATVVSILITFTGLKLWVFKK